MINPTKLLGSTMRLYDEVKPLLPKTSCEFNANKDPVLVGHCECSGFPSYKTKSNKVCKMAALLPQGAFKDH